MIFKIGDIVKIRNQIHKDRCVVGSGFYGRADLPEYVMNKVGEIIKIQTVEATFKRFPFERKAHIYMVYFLFDISIEYKYISEFTAFLFGDEIEMATEEEGKKFTGMKDILVAKEVADRL
jgi:hypothetical protein